MKTMKTMLPFLCCALLLAPAIASADSAPIVHRGIDGSDVVLIKNDRIRMVREVVNIDCAWTTYTVRADFWFKNTTGETQEVQFGFPIDYWNFYDGEVDIPEITKSIIVQWKDKPLTFTLAQLQRKESSSERRQWICWSATFAPNEEVYHRIGYTFPTSCCNGDGGDWQQEEPYSSLTYVLKTGAAWQGPIESAIVNIHYDHPLPRFFGYREDAIVYPKPSELEISPRGYSWDKDKKTVTWNFKNFVPSEDIQFAWRPPQTMSEFERDLIIRALIFVFTLIATATAVIVYVYKRIQKRKLQTSESARAPAGAI